MAKENLEVIREAVISNNCPECFNQELIVKFLQRHTYNRFYHRTTSDVQHQIQCMKCKSIIYPVKWTEDIERSFEYYRKTVKPLRPGVRFTGLFYGLFIGLLLIAGLLYYLYRAGIIQV